MIPCNTCMNFVQTDNAGSCMLTKNSYAGQPSQCGSYRFDPATEPVDDDDPQDVTW